MNGISVGGKIDLNSQNSRTFEERENELSKIEEAEKRLSENEKKCTYANWFQMNKKYGAEMTWLSTKEPRAMAILMFLSQLMDSYNSVIVSFKAMNEALDMSRSTLSRGVKVLSERGFIHVYRSGTSNVYTLNPDLFWSSWGKNKRYSKFPTNVVLSLSEQEGVKQKEIFSKLSKINKLE